MIKIKYIQNRLEKEGRKEEELYFNRYFVLIEYLQLSSFCYKDHDIVVNGKKIDNLEIFINDEDEIIITPKIEFAGIGSLLKVGATMMKFLTIVDIAITAYSIYSAIASRPKKPSFGTSSFGIDEGSPTYGWDGIKTQHDLNIAKQIVYGRHKVGGNVINSFIRNDGNKNFLNLLIALGEGEINQISEIKINGNPIENYDGITTAFRSGTNSQSIIPNFNDLRSLNDVNVELLKNDSHTYTTIDNDVKAFELLFNLVGGLYQQGTSGNIEQWTVTYKVEYKLTTSGTWIDLGETDIIDKNRSTVRRTFRQAGLAAGKYDIRVTKTSEDSSLDPIKQGDLTWTKVDEIKTDDLVYPNTALLGIEALASEQLSGSIPNVTMIEEGLKVEAPRITEINLYANTVAQYKMNDSAANTTVLDSVNGYNGASQQNTENISVPGKINEALSFNGTSDRISVPYNSAFNVNEYTVCFWVKIDDIGSTRGVITTRPSVISSETLDIEIESTGIKAKELQFGIITLRTEKKQIIFFL